jgi:autotransporter-associated beta strand protein
MKLKTRLETALRCMTLCAAVWLMVDDAAGGTTYFVSPGGSDSNPGTLLQPFQTLAKAVPSLNAGDTLYLRGGTYREMLAPVHSGTASQPITISSYSNEIATVSGCDILTNLWNYTSNGIYSASAGWDLGEGYNQVFVDGVMQHEAQYPNWTATNSLLNPPTVSVTVYNNYTAVSPNFGALGNLNGARFLGGVGLDWAWQTAVISSNSGNTLFLDSGTVSANPWWPNISNDASDTGNALIYGKLSLLNADGEWYLDSSGPRLYLRITGGANPTGHTVELKHRHWCVYVTNQTYLTVRGIQTRAGAVYLGGTNNVLDGCDLRYLSHYLTFGNGYQYDGGHTEGGGIVIYTGYTNTVRNCSIYDTAGSGINISGGKGDLITRNHIYNIDYAGTYAAALCFNSPQGNSAATFNTIHDTGRDVLRPTAPGLIVMFNDLSNSGRLCRDQGIIYTFGINGLSSGGVKTRIAYNWVHDGNANDPITEGIYIDDKSTNDVIDHNVTWNIGPNTWYQHGIKLNSGVGMELYHNTLINCGTYDHGASFMSNVIAENNFLLSNTTLLAANLINPAALDFRLQAGSSGIDPGFFIITNSHGITGQGVVLAGINEGFLGGTPDSGAYEYGGPYWQPGTNGWNVGQPMIQTAGATEITVGSARLLGTLISAGLSAATVQVCWGATDGGTNIADWPNQVTLGTNYTGSFTSLTQLIADLAPGSNYVFRFYASNSSSGGNSWGAAQSFTTFVTPANLIWDANPGSPGAQDGIGSWNNTSTNWWTGAGNSNFVNGCAAIFGSDSGAAGTVAISGQSVVAGGVTFNAPGSGNYVITNDGVHTLTLNSGGITANVSATFALAPVLCSDQTWTIAADQTLSVGNGVNAINLGNNTLTLVGGGVLALKGGGTIGDGSSSLLLSGGVLDLGNFSSTVGSVTIAVPSPNGNTIQNGSLTADSYVADFTNGNAIITANLFGSGGLMMSGTGILTLSGANRYSGGTTLNAGTLALGSDSALGTGPLTIANPTTLSALSDLTLSNDVALNAAPTLSFDTNNVTLAGNISGGSTTATLTVPGPGHLTLTGTNAIAQGTTTAQTLTVTGGVVELAGGSTALTNVALRNQSSADLLISGGTHYFMGTAVNFSGIILDANRHSLTMTGGAAYCSSFSMGFGGGISSTFNMNGGYFNCSGAGGHGFNFANNTGASDVTTLNLNGGTIATSSIGKGGGSAPAANSIINLNGGTLMAIGGSGNFLSGGSLGITVNVLSNGAVFDTAGASITLTNALLDGGGGGGLSKMGAGTLALSGSAPNTYRGVTINSAGELDLGKTPGVDAIGAGGLSISNGATVKLLAANQINDSAAVQAEGAFNLNGESESIDALCGGSGGAIDGGFGAPILNLGTRGGGGAFAGVIENTAGALSLTKLGAGTLTLTGSNTYAGGTTIVGGALLANNLGGSATGSGAVTVQSNATLGGNGIIGGMVTVQGGGTLSPGAPLGTLTISNDLVLNSNATTLIELNKTNSPATNDCLVVTGILSATRSTMIVTNLGPQLIAGDRFQLLSQPASGFTTITLPAGYAWTNKLAVDGSIQVLSVVASLPGPPTNITFNIRGSMLTLNWSSNYLGWVLQAQTNALNTGLKAASNRWFDVFASTNVTSMNIAINPANPSVFYRLRHP